MKISMGQITTLTKDMETDARTYPKAGFTPVELAFPKVYKYLETHTAPELKNLLDDAGIHAVSAIGMAPTKAGVMYARGEEAERYFDSLRAQLELCHTLGCELVNLGSDPDTFQYGGWEEQCVQNLRRAGALAAGFGMKVALEDGSLRRAVPLVQRTDMENVGYCIDYFWYYKHGQATEEMEAFDFTKLFNVHFCDLPAGFDVTSMDDGVRVLPGDGVLPLLHWSKLQRDAGYDGYLTLELLNEDIWQMEAGAACEACSRAMAPFAAL